MAPSATTATHENLLVKLSQAQPVLHTWTADELVAEALKERLESIDHEICQPGDEDAFFVADLGEVYRQHLRWKMNLKRVKPFYGMPFRHRLGDGLIAMCSGQVQS